LPVAKAVAVSDPADIRRDDCDYVATLQFRPIVETRSTFVEWTATFDCESAERESLRQTLEKMFSIWIASLDKAIAGGAR
jgi:hypothetical protein